MSDQTDQTRHIPLEGVHNLRHVGGYATLDGRVTRSSVLYRSDSLHRLTLADQHAILNLGIRTIIDLRGNVESETEPNVFARSDAITYRHLPLYNDWNELKHDGSNVPDQVQVDYYRNVLDQCHDGFRAVLEAAAEPDAFPLLVHCYAGKDRTGLIVGLLLGLAKVPTETIVADYTLSETYSEPLISETRTRWERDGYDMAYWNYFLRSPPDDMFATLDYLTRQYGGVEGYLHAIGLNEDQMDRLRMELVG